MHSRYFRCVCKPPGAGPCLGIWLRGSRYLCAVVFWAYLTITGNALLVKAIYIIRLSMVLLPPPCCLVHAHS
jgi:hypothetical protein